jgi:hypothetical protein
MLAPHCPLMFACLQWQQKKVCYNDAGSLHEIEWAHISAAFWNSNETDGRFRTHSVPHTFHRQRQLFQRREDISTPGILPPPELCGHIISIEHIFPVSIDGISSS